MKPRRLAAVVPFARASEATRPACIARWVEAHDAAMAAGDAYNLAHGITVMPAIEFAAVCDAALAAFDKCKEALDWCRSAARVGDIMVEGTGYKALEWVAAKERWVTEQIAKIRTERDLRARSAVLVFVITPTTPARRRRAIRSTRSAVSA